MRRRCVKKYHELFHLGSSFYKRADTSFPSWTLKINYIKGRLVFLSLAWLFSMETWEASVTKKIYLLKEDQCNSDRTSTLEIRTTWSYTSYVSDIIIVLIEKSKCNAQRLFELIWSTIIIIYRFCWQFLFFFHSMCSKRSMKKNYI